MSNLTALDQSELSKLGLNKVSIIDSQHIGAPSVDVGIEGQAGKSTVVVFCLVSWGTAVNTFREVSANQIEFDLAAAIDPFTNNWFIYDISVDPDSVGWFVNIEFPGRTGGEGTNIVIAKSKVLGNK